MAYKRVRKDFYWNVGFIVWPNSAGCTVFVCHTRLRQTVSETDTSVQPEVNLLLREEMEYVTCINISLQMHYFFYTS